MPSRATDTRTGGVFMAASAPPRASTPARGSQGNVGPSTELFACQERVESSIDNASGRDIHAVVHHHTLGWNAEDLSAFALRLVIQLPPFSFKRAHQVVVINGHGSIGLTSKAKQWLRAASAQLAQQWAEVFRGAIPRHIELNAAIRSYLPTRQEPDASNLYEAPQDALKCHTRWCKPKCDRHAGVICDDAQIRTHNGSDRLHDKDHPRVEIVLTPYIGDAHDSK